MRLLVFDEEIFSGGVETLCFNLLPALARRCELLVWAAPDHLHPDFRGRIGGAPNLVIEGHNWPRGTPPGCLAGMARRFGVLPQAFRDGRIRSLARKHRCAHFLTTCVFSQPFPRLGAPVFGFVCDVNPDMPDNAKRNIPSWIEAAAGIFAISDFTRDELRRLRPACADRIHSVPLAAPPLDAWDPKPAAMREYDFYCPGVANPHKNHRVLFEACAALAGEGGKFRLAVSGPGTAFFGADRELATPHLEEAREVLRKHAALLDGAVRALGDVKPPGVAALYENTRCVLLPSSYEGFGFPLAEALSRGLPVICSDIPPFREQIALYGAPRNVRTVPAGDAARLAAAMRDFLDGKNGAQLETPAPPRTWEDVAQRAFDLLSRLP